MNQRPFGNIGQVVSEIGFGAWAIGGSWGEVSESDAKAALHAALDSGTTFIDTADVYGDGRSERPEDGLLQLVPANLGEVGEDDAHDQRCFHTLPEGDDKRLQHKVFLFRLRNRPSEME